MNPGIFWDLAGRDLNQIMIFFSYRNPDNIRVTDLVVSMIQHSCLPMKGNMPGTQQDLPVEK